MTTTNGPAAINEIASRAASSTHLHFLLEPVRLGLRSPSPHGTAQVDLAGAAPPLVAAVARHDAEEVHLLRDRRDDRRRRREGGGARPRGGAAQGARGARGARQRRGRRGGDGAALPRDGPGGRDLRRRRGLLRARDQGRVARRVPARRLRVVQRAAHRGDHAVARGARAGGDAPADEDRRRLVRPDPAHLGELHRVLRDRARRRCAPPRNSLRAILSARNSVGAPSSERGASYTRAQGSRRSR